MSMRVAFNATPLLSPLTGIGNYIVELGTALARLNEVDAYSFYRYRWRHESPTVPAANGRIGSGFVEKMKPLVPFRGGLRHAAKFLGFRRGLRRFRIDLYHEQNYIPLSFDAPVVITIHDLSWIRYPASHPADRVRWLEKGLPRAVDRARLILVDSEFVRQEVLSTFGLEPTRVRTTYLGVKEAFAPRTAADAASTLSALNLEYGQYVLSVGTIEPRKNLQHVLDAFERLPAALRERYPLVVAGANGWQSSDLLKRIHNLSDRQVRFLGPVDQGRLPDLYAGAAVFVFPSLYEGFGFPPLEAMASGVPVIVSDRASLPEIVDDAGELMNPEDPVETSERLRSMLEDPAHRRELAWRGIAQAARFTWAACAENTLESYRFALVGAPSLRASPDVVRSAASERLDAGTP